MYVCAVRFFPPVCAAEDTKKEKNTRRHVGSGCILSTAPDVFPKLLSCLNYQILRLPTHQQVCLGVLNASDWRYSVFFFFLFILSIHLIAVTSITIQPRFTGGTVWNLGKGTTPYVYNTRSCFVFNFKGFLHETWLPLSVNFFYCCSFNTTTRPFSSLKLSLDDR